MKSATLLGLLLAFSPFLASADERLTSLREISAFLEGATPRSVPFAVTARVQNSARSLQAGEIILAADDGTRIEGYRSLTDELPAPGDTIIAEGLAQVSDAHEPYVTIKSFSVCEHGTKPEPVDVQLAKLTAKSHHLLSIRTEGVVIDAYPDEIDFRYLILLLKDEDAVVPIAFPRDEFGDRRDLVDARIRVTGIYRRSVGGLRKFSWPNINPQRPEDLEVLEPAPADPFSVPPIEARLYLTSEEIAHMTKRSAVGEVLACWSNDQAMMRLKDGRIVNLKLARGEPLPACGSTIIAVGQPETDHFHINLSSTRWKPLAATGPVPTEPPETDLAATLWDDHGRHSFRSEAHGKLFRVRGIVRTLPSRDETDRRFQLDTGDTTIPVDLTTNPSALAALEIGCEVLVTGRCLLLTDAQAHDLRTARIRGFALVLRSPEDLRILKRPSWWTLSRLSIVISILLAALTAIYIWNRILRNLANRRGRELYREQIAHAISEFKTSERTRLAVELHDSLSQTLSAIACHMTVGAEMFVSEPATARHYLATARKMLDSCRTELRQCLFDLRSDTLEEPDFASAIRKSLNQVDGEAEITVRFDAPRRLFQDTTAHAILAIIRELTGNAIRHGQATEVTIDGRLEHNALRFTVCDNGHGFDPAHCNGPREGHFGLEGIRNRLEKVDGTFTLDAAPGRGVTATIIIPLPSQHPLEGTAS